MNRSILFFQEVRQEQAADSQQQPDNQITVVAAFTSKNLVRRFMDRSMSLTVKWKQKR